MIEELRAENERLKKQVEALSQKEKIEDVVKENVALKTSILSFKQEFEAQVIL